MPVKMVSPPLACGIRSPDVPLHRQRTSYVVVGLSVACCEPTLRRQNQNAVEKSPEGVKAVAFSICIELKPTAVTPCAIEIVRAGIHVKI